MEDFDFKKDVSIHPGELDLEWLRQAALYQKYSEALADANDRVRRAEQKVKVVCSELTLAATRTPELMGKDVKPTGGNVEAYYRTHPDHIAAKDDWMDAEKSAEHIQNAVYAISQKKTALENLVKLMLGGYFAGPTVPRDLHNEWTQTIQERKEKRQVAVTDKIRERTRKVRGEE